MEFQKLLSSMHPILIIAVVVTVFLSSLLAQWIMPKLPVTPKPKRASEKSSFAIRRYETQPITEEPFCAFDNSFGQDHEGLTAFGSWTNCDDPEPPYGLEPPNWAPYNGYYTFRNGADY